MNNEIWRASRRALLVRAGVSVASLATSSFARSQNVATGKVIRIVVTTAPGGLTDLVARQYGEFIGRKLGQTVVVDNRPGGGGTIGSAVVAKAAPDGQTLLMTSSSGVWQSRVLFNQLSYDPEKELTPISLFYSGPVPLGVHSALPVRTAPELLAYARQNKVNLGTYSAGSLPHMVADHWKRTESVDIQAVHYRGETPMWVDVAGGQTHAGVGSLQALAPHMQRGTIRPIGLFGSIRNPLLPDVPTLQEQGMKGAILNLNLWLSLCAPAGTPDDVLQRLSNAVREAHDSPSVREMNRNFGIPVGPTDLSEARRRWADEAPQWQIAAEQLGLKLN